MMGNIAEVVASDPHVLKIIPSKYSSLPEVDDSNFSGDVSWELDRLRQFLRMPYILDEFTDHEKERKPWLNRMYAEHGREFWDFAVRGNALKRGNFVNINGGYAPFVDTLARHYCGVDKESFALLVDSAKNEHLPVQEYEILPVSVKILHVQQLKEHAYALLKFCEKNKVFQETA